MNAATKILTYILAGILVLGLGALTGWYFFLHSKEAMTTATDLARGLGAEVPPSFPGATGSTGQNILEANGGSNSSGNKTIERLWEVDKTPVAGFGFVTTGTTTELYFVERAEGYVFSADPMQQNVVRLTNTLMPKVDEALISYDGSVILRSLDSSGNITTFAGIATASASTTIDSSATSSAPDQLKGTYLPANISEIALNPETDGLFYLSAVPGGVSGVSETWTGTKQKQIFSSPIADWRIEWLPGSEMILTESAADDVPGFSYQLGSTGVLSPLVGNVPGLTVVSDASTSAVLFGASSGGSLSLYVQLKPGETPSALPIRTVADKCAWAPGPSQIAYCAVPAVAPSGQFLDDWYQGKVHTSDAFWQIDAAATTTQELFAPQSVGVSNIDVEDPVVDPSGNYIAFRNAADQSLWILRITQ